MEELHERVRERVRAELVRHGASAALEDRALFAEIDALLRSAIDRSQPAALLLPELLGDPSAWRLDTAIKYQSHRGAAGGPIVFVKRRLLMPVQATQGVEPLEAHSEVGAALGRGDRVHFVDDHGLHRRK